MYKWRALIAEFPSRKSTLLCDINLLSKLQWVQDYQLSSHYYPNWILIYDNKIDIIPLILYKYIYTTIIHGFTGLMAIILDHQNRLKSSWFLLANCFIQHYCRFILQSSYCFIVHYYYSFILNYCYDAELSIYLVIRLIRYDY